MGYNIILIIMSHQSKKQSKAKREKKRKEKKRQEKINILFCVYNLQFRHRDVSVLLRFSSRFFFQGIPVYKQVYFSQNNIRFLVFKCRYTVPVTYLILSFYHFV